MPLAFEFIEEAIIMLLSEADFVELYMKLDGYRLATINRKTTKVRYAKDTKIYDMKNQTDFLWVMRKIKNQGWIPYLKGTHFGINQPLEIDEEFLSTEFKNIYEITDPVGHELSRGLLKIHEKHSRDYQERLKDAMIEKQYEETFSKALLVAVDRYKKGKSVPPTMLADVLEYIRKNEG